MSKYNGKIIAIVNQKGGVGKTTTTTNLATALATIYDKILVIDLDPQGNASTGFGISPESRVKTIYDVIADDIKLSEAILCTSIPNLDIISATVDLSAAEIELIDVPQREYQLKKKISEIRNRYDYILIDCPPSLGILTLNALTSADSILIPLQCEFFALEGLSHLLKTVSLVQKRLNSSLELEGIVLTMYDKRNKLTEHVEQDVRNCLQELVFNTVIPRNVRISEAPSYGKPALIYDLKCSGSVAYIDLAKELLKKRSNKFANKKLETL